jgi:CheY-like chemotaxis protein
VLVVDDDEVARFAAQQLLKTLGLTVDFANDGREALQMSARWPYVAIFMDCTMPEVDGYTAARQIGQREGLGRHTPVIAVTSHPRSVCIASGMDHHVSKPLKLEMLRTDLTRLGVLPREAARPSEPGPMHNVQTPLLKSPDEKIDSKNPLPATDLWARFVREATLRLPELWRAANAGDASTLHRVAHELKVRAARVGVARVADEADRLSKAAASGHTALAASIEPQLRLALSDTAAEVRSLLMSAARPAANETEAPATQAVEPTADPEPPAPVRVAIADDDPLARIAVEAMIEHAEGLAFVGSANGVDEIVDLTSVRRPDAVVLDWMMPAGGGPEAARRIRTSSPDTVIVGLTSSEGPEAYAEMISAGASACLVKGVSADKLATTIQQALRHSNLRARPPRRGPVASRQTD